MLLPVYSILVCMFVGLFCQSVRHIITGLTPSSIININIKIIIIIVVVFEQLSGDKVRAHEMTVL